MESTILLGCPFCGWRPIHSAGERDDEGMWLRLPCVSCSCGASVKHRYHDVVKLWNSRVEEGCESTT
jgi:hypothetical protein